MVRTIWNSAHVGCALFGRVAEKLDVGGRCQSLRFVIGDMRMHNEEGPDADKPVENGEPMNLGAPETSEVTVGKKYRELRSRLKYLIYVRG